MILTITETIRGVGSAYLNFANRVNNARVRFDPQGLIPCMQDTYRNPYRL